MYYKNPSLHFYENLYICICQKLILYIFFSICIHSLYLMDKGCDGKCFRVLTEPVNSIVFLIIGEKKKRTVFQLVFDSYTTPYSISTIAKRPAPAPIEDHFMSSLI